MRALICGLSGEGGEGLMSIRKKFEMTLIDLTEWVKLNTEQKINKRVLMES